MSGRLVLLGACASLALVACNPHRVTENPAPPVPVPERYSIVSSGALPEKWWREFGDPDLDRLIERSLRGNLQLGAAWARLEQARAVARQASSGRWPQAQLDASAVRRRNRFDLGEQGVFTPVINIFTVSASASYEVDVWKRISSSARAAGLDLAASRDDVEAMAMTIVAEITDAWWDVVLQRAQRKLVSEQVKTSEQFLELTKLRFQQGMASALDVHQQNRNTIGLRAQLSLVDAALKVLENRLAVLVGQPPGAVVSGTRDQLPTPAGLPGTGVPADLLERRPDVRAARRRVEAADHRVAAAVADRLPALRLSADTSLQDRTLSGLIASPLYSLIASITAPLFDGGRRRAEVDRNRAVVKERLMQYGQVLLGAMSEVENALVQEKQQKLYIADLERQLEVSRAALREARERYRAGLTDYLVVLTSLQAQQQVELGLLDAQRQLLRFRVQLCRALGGTWTRKIAPPDASDAGGSKEKKS